MIIHVNKSNDWRTLEHQYITLNTEAQEKITNIKAQKEWKSKQKLQNLNSSLTHKKLVPNNNLNPNRVEPFYFSQR
jgi:hypothetical protein